MDHKPAKGKEKMKTKLHIVVCIILLSFISINEAQSITVNLGLDKTIYPSNFDIYDSSTLTPAPYNPGSSHPDILSSFASKSSPGKLETHVMVSVDNDFDGNDVIYGSEESGNSDATIGVNIHFEGKNGDSLEAVVRVYYEIYAYVGLNETGGTAHVILSDSENNLHHEVRCTTAGYDKPLTCGKSITGSKIYNFERTFFSGENYELSFHAYSHADASLYTSVAYCSFKIRRIEIDFKETSSFQNIEQTNGKPKSKLKTEGDPVNIINGNMYIIEDDLKIDSSIIPFGFTRTYNSIDESTEVYLPHTSFLASLNEPVYQNISVESDSVNNKICYEIQLENDETNQSCTRLGSRTFGTIHNNDGVVAWGSSNSLYNTTNSRIYHVIWDPKRESWQEGYTSVGSRQVGTIHNSAGIVTWGSANSYMSTNTRVYYVAYDPEIGQWVDNYTDIGGRTMGKIQSSNGVVAWGSANKLYNATNNRVYYSTYDPSISAWKDDYTDIGSRTVGRIHNNSGVVVWGSANKLYNATNTRVYYAIYDQQSAEWKKGYTDIGRRALGTIFIYNGMISWLSANKTYSPTNMKLYYIIYNSNQERFEVESTQDFDIESEFSILEMNYPLITYRIGNEEYSREYDFVEQVWTDNNSVKTSCLGQGWTHNFNFRLRTPVNSFAPVFIYDEKGKGIMFEQVSQGVFEAPIGNYSKLIKTETGYLWQKKDKYKYLFNHKGFLESIIDRNDNALTLSYDANYRLVSIENSEGKTIHLTYNKGQLSKVNDFKNRSVVFQYSGNNLIKAINPEQEKITYQYTDLGNISKISNRTVNDSFKFDYDYDEQGRCIKSGGESGKLMYRFEYHPDELYTKITDPTGNIEFKHYDKYGKIIKVEHPDGTTESFAFDDDLNLIEKNNQDGTIWEYEYDSRGNITNIIDPLNNESTMVYDENDNLVSITDEVGKTTTNTYDENSNLLKVQYPDGTTNVFSYNSKGQMLTSADPEGNTTTFVYDSQGNLKSTISPLEHTTSYTYDSLGRKISETDANGNTTYFEYDALSRIIKVTDALSGEVNTTHTTAGMESLTDQNSNTTNFEYDSVDQLTQTTDPLNKSRTSNYDGNGNLSSATDYNGNTVTYTHDSLNRLSSITYPDSTNVSYTYDNMSRVTQMTDSTGESNYSYDDLGRLISYTNSDGKEVSYAYDEVGNLISLTYPGNKTITYSYDDNDRLEQITDWSGRQTVYSYNTRGLLINTMLPNGSTIEYDYDETGRMIELLNTKSDGTAIAHYSLTLDKNGNIISENAIHPLEPTFEAEEVVSTYGIDNRLNTSGELPCTYDANGNLIKKGGATYQYDYENRLIQLLTSDGTWTYTYDGNGNRLRVSHDGNIRNFVLDIRGMTQVLSEYNKIGVIESYYIYGLGLLYKVDENDNPFFYHYNMTGHTVAMTDNDENIANKYAYSPFGIPAGRIETETNSFCFAGKHGVMNEENGLFYMRARYYDFDTGRFLNKDPLGFGGGVNLYAYAKNNPVSLIDPLGLCPSDKNEDIIFLVQDTLDELNSRKKELTNQLYQYNIDQYKLRRGFEIIWNIAKDSALPIPIPIDGIILTFLNQAKIEIDSQRKKYEIDREIIHLNRQIKKYRQIHEIIW